MKPIDRVYATLYHEEPDKVPDGKDIKTVPGPTRITIIKEAPGIRVWKSDFGSIHMTMSQEMTLRRKGPDTQSTWRYTLAPAIRWPEDLERQEQPQLDMNYVRSVKQRTQELHERGYFVKISHRGVFDFPFRYLRGMKQWLIDVIKDPPFARRLIEFAAKPVMNASNVLIEEAGIDAVMIVGDMGTTKGPFISPHRYRELIYDWHRRLAQSYHRRGAFLFIHSHGYLMPIMDDMVRAGFDVINPVSPLCGMDLAEMKEKYGDHVTLWADLAWDIEAKGRFDPLKFGRIKNGLEPVEEIIEHAKYTLNIGAPGGGFISPLPGRFANEKERGKVSKLWERLRAYNRVKVTHP